LKKREDTNLEKFGATQVHKGAAFQEKVQQRRQAKAEEHKAAVEQRAVERKRKREEARQAKVATLGPDYHAEVARIMNKKQKIEQERDASEQDGSLPPLVVTPIKPRIIGAPRWPEPQPIRSNYPDLSYQQWDRLVRAWRNSQPHSCAIRAIYDKSARGKMVRQQEYIKHKDRRVIYTTSLRAKELQARRRRIQVILSKLQPPGAETRAKNSKKSAKYHALVKCAYNSLREQVSIDGHCAYRDRDTGSYSCKIRAKECDIHHLDPNAILPDGLRRKQSNFSRLGSLLAIRREIARNTDEAGMLLLQALCPRHHARVSFGAACYKRTGGLVEHRWRMVAAIKLEIGRCQYEECEFKGELCSTLEDTPAFHFDHKFTAQDREVPDEMKKVGAIGDMVRLTHRYSQADLEREIAKCRLVHALCHHRISAAQRAQGRILARPLRSKADQETS
jgi:hypothetical protein